MHRSAWFLLLRPLVLTIMTETRRLIQTYSIWRKLANKMQIKITLSSSGGQPLILRRNKKIQSGSNFQNVPRACVYIIK